MIAIDNKEVGFIYKNNQNIDKLLNNGNLIFEQGFIREASGSTPLATPTLSTGKNLKNYKIYGNSVQNGTPSPSNPVEIESVGDKSKNIFDETLFTQYMKKDGDYWVAPFYDVYTNYRRTKRGFLDSYNFKENTSYTVTMSGYVKDSSFAIGVQYTDGTYGVVARLKSTSETIVTGTTNSSKTIDFFYADFGNDKTLYFKYMQIEEGSATSYEPYGYKIPIVVGDGTNSSTTNIYLNEPLRKIGDYADYIDFENQKVVRKIYEKVFDGTEGFSSQTVAQGTLLRNYSIVYATEYLYQSALCNMYPVIRSRVDKSLSGANTAHNATDFLDSNYPTVSDWQNHLLELYQAGTPLKVYYALETPTEESVTLPTVPSLKGNIIYSVGTEIQPSSMYIKYKGR